MQNKLKCKECGEEIRFGKICKDCSENYFFQWKQKVIQEQNKVFN